jgi:hypothetical protein
MFSEQENTPIIRTKKKPSFFIMENNLDKCIKIKINS